MGENSSRFVAALHTRASKSLYIKICLILVTLLTLVGLLVWRSVSNPLLLPRSATQQIHAFTPYFFAHSVPADYTFDKHQIVYNGQVLMIPLTKSASPTIVLTEQALPAKLPDEAIQENGQGVAVNIGKASINHIEGRLVGTLIPDGRTTLILLNAPGDASEDDLRALLQGLLPVTGH